VRPSFLCRCKTLPSTNVRQKENIEKGRVLRVRGRGGGFTHWREAGNVMPASDVIELSLRNRALCCSTKCVNARHKLHTKDQVRVKDVMPCIERGETHCSDAGISIPTRDMSPSEVSLLFSRFTNLPGNSAQSKSASGARLCCGKEKSPRGSDVVEGSGRDRRDFRPRQIDSPTHCLFAHPVAHQRRSCARKIDRSRSDRFLADVTSKI